MDQNNVVMELFNRVIALENRVNTLEEKISSMQNQMPSVRPKLSKKYMPITQYLENSGEDVVVMSFGQIDQLLRQSNSRLPISAVRHQAFWANSDTHSIALSWMAAGYEVDHVDRKREEVIFKKKQDRGASF